MGFFSRLLGGNGNTGVDNRATPRPASPAPRHAATAPQPEPEEAADDGEGLIGFFTEDHRSCDRDWAAVEAAADGGDLLAAFTAFDKHMRKHLAMEEDVLFPAFEESTGMVGGPTHVMRGEHVQMRALLDEMGRLAHAGDARGVLDQGDTLMMLIQQHNVKEEGMLYPMCSMHLAWAPIKGKIAGY